MDRSAYRLLSAVTLAQEKALVKGDPAGIFETMLKEVLDITDSAFGFMGEVLYTAEGQPFLKTHALTNIVWDAGSRALYDKHLNNEMEFHNLGTLFGEVLKTGELVIANDPAHDPRCGGLPDGHPPIEAFFGLPVYKEEEMVGLIGLANRPGGYGKEIISFLEPLVTTSATLITSFRNEKRRIQAENALHESEDRYRDLVENSHDLICTHDLNGRVLSLNSRPARLMGYPPETLIGKDLRHLLGPETRDKFGSYLEKIKAKGTAKGLITVQTAKGEKRIWKFENTLRTQGVDEPIVRGMARDVTEQKEAERALRESEILFRNLFKHHAAVKIIVDSDNGKIIDANQAAERFYGWTGDQLRRMSVHDLNVLPLEEVDQVIEKIKSHKQNRFELRHHLADGSIRDVEVFSSKVVTKGRGLIHSIVHDITERKQAEIERERLRAAIDQAGEMILITDAGGTIQYVNPAFERSTGFTQAEAGGQNLRFFKSGKQDDEYYRNLWETISGGKTFQGRMVNQRKDKTLYTEEITISPVFDTTGAIVNYVAVKRDITKNLLMAAQSQQSQKLESLGVLAGGIAHDFNNLLMGIIGNAGLLRTKLDPGTPGIEPLAQIEKAAERAAELTNQLLAYSGKGKFVINTVDLSSMVEEMAQLLETVLSRNVVLQMDLAKDLPFIEADATQIRQVIMNLMTNASDAVKETSGTVTIVTGSMECDSRYLSRFYMGEGLKEGPYVYLQITDTGYGMTQETLEKIFDPFFSTKENGRGLGLSAVIGIVGGHKGAIKVYTEPGSGTEFKVLFPACQRVIEGVQEEKSEYKKFRGEGCVLLVDDEEIVRSTTEMILKEYGFDVLLAVNGQDAIEVFWERNDEISLVLMDLTMPRMGGAEATRHIKQIRPDVPVLLSSGYTEEEVVNTLTEKGLAGFIQKPYSPEALLSKIAEALKTPEPR